MTPVINGKFYFDNTLLMKLKKAYEEARSLGKESFMFEGREVLVSFAKYLIEYLEGVLK